MTTEGGAVAPQGPGWWLASDGRYYPPDLSPGTGSNGGPAAAPGSTGAAPKKKVVKKKIAAKSPGPAPASSSAARPGKKKVVKKKAVAPLPSPPGDAEEHSVDLTEKRPGHLKYTAKPPPSDQVAARRIQAKEQMVLLTGARQAAALRLLANLGEPEPVLVGVGGRDLDARSHHGAEHQTSPSRPATARPGGPGGTPERGASAPTIERHDGPAAPPPADEPPARADVPADAEAEAAPTAAEDAILPPVTENPEIPVQAAAPPPPPAPVADAPAPQAEPADPEPADPEPERVVPHQPEIGPAPAPAPMGTDVPFMEVKGSALGTDIDRIGERILIYADRVELRDRTNGVRQSIRYDQLAAVEVQKKMMGPTLLITSVGGGTMTAKALRPELATGAKAMIEKHAARFRGEAPRPGSAERPPPVEPPPMTTPGAPEPVTMPAEPPPAAMPAEPPPAAMPAATRTHRSVLMAMLDELHAAGILSPDEMEQKRALIERNDRT